jgi:hypothetical protein
MQLHNNYIEQGTSSERRKSGSEENLLLRQEGKMRVEICVKRAASALFAQ